MSIFGSLWARLRAIGLVTAAGLFVSGILFWGGFHWALEMTNTERFCTSCHEMRDNTFKEYRNTAHYANRTGVRATCSDCHVPRDWQHKVIRKIRASNELLHKVLGTIDTREKFEARRIALARLEWQRMKATDSRECRNCHRYDFMDYALQGRRAGVQHEKGVREGKTCIDCHKGVVHTLPPIDQGVGAPRIDEVRSEELTPVSASSESRP